MQDDEAMDGYPPAAPRYNAKHRRPALVIESEGQTKLGNCYWEYRTKVTCIYKLTAEKIKYLRAGGFITDGQEFNVVKEQELFDTWAYEGKDFKCNPFQPTNNAYWVYHIVTRVDSGD